MYGSSPGNCILAWTQKARVPCTSLVACVRMLWRLRHLKCRTGASLTWPHKSRLALLSFGKRKDIIGRAAAIIQVLPWPARSMKSDDQYSGSSANGRSNIPHFHTSYSCLWLGQLGSLKRAWMIPSYRKQA